MNQIDPEGMRSRVSDALEKYFQNQELTDTEQRIISYWHFAGGCSSCSASNSISAINTASEHEEFEDSNEKWI